MSTLEDFIEEQTRILDRILIAGEQWSALSIDGQRKAVAKLREAVGILKPYEFPDHRRCPVCHMTWLLGEVDQRHLNDCEAQKFLEG